ncbi:MAG: hypothetical protein IJ068_01845 [Bacilli bacterium]|nr:hypothetical protein [Bacilli bacterium]
MADLVWSEARLSQMTERLNQNIRKIEEELETFEKNYEIIKRNWAGDEFNKADPKLLEIRKTLQTAIEDNRKQMQYLSEKNSNFHGIVSGL